MPSNFGICACSFCFAHFSIVDVTLPRESFPSGVLKCIYVRDADNFDIQYDCGVDGDDADTRFLDG